MTKVIMTQQPSFKRKVITVLAEILIIVFAITFSLFLERWREHSHDREIEKEFLTELRGSLFLKNKEMKQDSLNYAFIYNSWKYLYDVSSGKLSIDSTKAENALKSFKMVLLLNSNNSLFESIKSSGKLYVVRDKELLKNIISYFEEQLPTLVKSIESFYYADKQKIEEILGAVAGQYQNRNEYFSNVLIKNQPLNYWLSKYYEIEMITDFYGYTLKSGNNIIEEIDRSLNN